MKRAISIAVVTLMLLCLVMSALAEAAPDAWGGRQCAGRDPWGNALIVTIESVVDGRVTWSIIDAFPGATLYQRFEDVGVQNGAIAFQIDASSLENAALRYDYAGTLAFEDDGIALTYASGEGTEESPNGGSTSYHVEALDDAARTVRLASVDAD